MTRIWRRFPVELRGLPMNIESSAGASDVENSLDQWVVLSLDSHEYALPVQSVIEVLRMATLRPLPEAPPFIAGLLNLRGQGIVVLDLLKRLGLPAKEPDLNSQIVIVETKNG